MRVVSCTKKNSKIHIMHGTNTGILVRVKRMLGVMGPMSNIRMQDRNPEVTSFHQMAWSI